MTDSKGSKNTDKLTKSSEKGSVELSEAALGQASGGAVFPSMPAANSIKIDSSIKIDGTVLLPAVNKV